MIEVNKIFKSFDKSEVLNQINTVFHRGKTNLIIGQSGSGKTVLLKCLLGLYEVDSGEIIYDGVSSKNMNSDEKLEISRQMGMVFQGSALFDSMNVLENVSKMCMQNGTLLNLLLSSALLAPRRQHRIQFVCQGATNHL